MHKTPISVIILATIPDSGMKSLGSKSLFRFVKNKMLIDHQLETISSALKNTDHEIILVCGFDYNRVQKTLQGYEKKFPLQIVKQTDNNINCAGAFLTGLDRIKYDSVLSINYGCVFAKQTIQKIARDTAINNIAIAKQHRHNDNITTGCYLQDNQIMNIFFNLGKHKYLDINFWNHHTISYIKKNLAFENHKNQFMFEIINKLINHDYSFEYSDIDPQDCMLISNLKTLTKTKRIFINASANSKKTKY